MPGRNAFVTPLLKIKKFQNFGYRMGARKVCQLQTSELGTLKGLRAQADERG